MFRLVKIFLYFCFLFSFSILMAEKPSLVLKKSLNSVVTIYAVSYKNPQDIELFLKTSDPVGGNSSAGSGVIVESSGIIITNYHVIDNKSTIKVVMNDGRIFKADLISFDKGLDLALLKMENQNATFSSINIASSNNISIGDTVFAVGNPFSVGISVTSGIISALPNSKSGSYKMGNLIQTDAAMNPGNSGGALLDENGNLIGVNTAIFSKSGTFLGIGFAIPSDVVKLFINRSLSGKKLNQYWLGFLAVKVNNEIAKNYKLESPKGVIITQIFKNGPAFNSKLKVGDIVFKVNGKEISSVNEVSFLVASLENNDPISIEVLSNGEILEKTIIPGEPIQEVPANITNIEDGPFSGITIANNSSAISYYTGRSYVVDSVVIYDLNSSSVLSKLGIKRGDILVSIDNIEIKNVDDVINIVNKNKVGKNSYNLVIQRYNTAINLSLKLK